MTGIIYINTTVLSRFRLDHRRINDSHECPAHHRISRYWISTAKKWVSLLFGYGGSITRDLVVRTCCYVFNLWLCFQKLTPAQKLDLSCLTVNHSLTNLQCMIASPMLCSHSLLFCSLVLGQNGSIQRAFVFLSQSGPIHRVFVFLSQSGSIQHVFVFSVLLFSKTMNALWSIQTTKYLWICIKCMCCIVVCENFEFFFPLE